MTGYRCSVCSRAGGTWECGECGAVATPLLVGPPQGATPLHEEIEAYTTAATHAEDTVFAIPMPVLVRWEVAARALAAQLARAAPWVCPDCGPHARIDEDGCCATCGADCQHSATGRAGAMVLGRFGVRRP